MSEPRRPKASDISDETCLEAVRAVRGRWASSWSMLPDIQEKLRVYPPKVVLAKLKQLVKKNKLDGCTCGCRGDFEEL